MKHLSLSLLFGILLSILSSSALWAEDPKAELAKVAEEIKAIDAQMAKATEAKDRAKYDELAAKRQQFVDKFEALKVKVDAGNAASITEAEAKKAYNDAGAQLRSGNPTEAVNLYKRSLELDPTNVSAYYNLGVAYMKVKQPEDARRAFQKVVEMDPKNAQAYLALGNIESRRQEDETALRHYRQALAIDSTLEKAHFGIGNVYFRTNDFTQAAAAYKKAVAVDSKFDDAWVALGRSLQGLNLLEESITAFDRAVAANPKSDDGYFYRAELLNKKGNYADALKSAESSLTIRKTNKAPVLFEKGLALAGLGRKAEALKVFEEVKQDRAWRESAQFQIDVLSGKIKQNQ